MSKIYRSGQGDGEFQAMVILRGDADRPAMFMDDHLGNGDIRPV